MISHHNEVRTHFRKAVFHPFVVRHDKHRESALGSFGIHVYRAFDFLLVVLYAHIFHFHGEKFAVLMAKNIDGVYNADPAKDPTAVKYDHITFDEVLANHLAVMDTTATSLAMDNKMPVLVFALKDPENILRVLNGEQIGTIVKEAF
mgnify:CR=1 FL=1